MKTMYRSYREDHSEQEPTEQELVKTDPRIQRPICPVCRTEIYVTPMQYGAPDAPEIIEQRVDPLNEGFATVTYSCLVEDYVWDCARCFICF